MKKKLLIRAAIGFVCGIAIGYLVPLISCLAAGHPVTLYSDRLRAALGSAAAALIVQAAVSGLYGAICMGGTVLYEIEHWPLIRAVALHYLLCIVPFLPIALLLNWCSGAVELLIMLGIMTVIYFLIWLIMFLRYRAEVRELNDINRRRSAHAAAADDTNPASGSKEDKGEQ